MRAERSLLEVLLGCLAWSLILQGPCGAEHRLLDDAAQLPDIAGPAIVLQDGQRLGVEAGEVQTEVTVKLEQEVMHKFRDVLGPLPQGRHADGQAAQSIVQVGSKSALLRGRYGKRSAQMATRSG